MFKSPNLVKTYARFWLILALIELAFVIVMNIYDPPSGPEANLSSAFLLFGLLIIGFMAAVAAVALRTSRKWLQIVTTILLGLNPLLFFIPIPYIYYLLAPLNFIAMCYVLYSLFRKSSRPEPR